MTRILTALATLTVGLFAPNPPHPHVARPPAASAPAEANRPAAALPASASAPLSAELPPTALPVPEAAEDAIPAAVAADLQAFGLSQDLGAPRAVRAWIADLDHDGRDDALAEARYGDPGAGGEVVYHFPYFADGAGYRRGSAMSLAQGIVAVARDGAAFLVTVQQGSDAADGAAARAIMRLSF